MKTITRTALFGWLAKCNLASDSEHVRRLLPLPGKAGALLLAAVAWQLSAAAQVVTDNFDAGTLSSDWQVRNVVQLLGGYVNNSFPSNGTGKALRLQRGSANMAPLGQPQAYGTGRAWLFRTNVYTDFYVAQDLVNWNNTTNQALVLLSRASGYDDTLGPGFPPGLGTVNGYVCNYDNLQDGDTSGDRFGGEFQINRVDGEAPRTIAAAEVTLIPGHGYRQVFVGVGSRFTGQLFDIEDLTTPIVTIQADDSTYPSGVSGIVSFQRDDTIHPNLTDITVDNYYAAPADPNSDITPAIRHPIAGTPQVVTRTPAARFTNFYPPAGGIQFTARTFATNLIDTAATKLFLNGVDVSASLAPLPPNGTTATFTAAAGTLSDYTIYSARIELQDTTGALKSTNTFWFDTFSEAFLRVAPTRTVEAEDYNYSSGLFQLEPIPVSGIDTNGSAVNGGGVGYYDQAGTPEVDYHDNRTSTEGGWNDYRTADFAGTVQGNREDIQDLNHPAPTTPAYADPTRPNDTTRQQYATVSLKEYEVARTEAGEWLNYTRVFADTNYLVYLRCGSYGAQDVELALVSGDTTSTSQTTTALGTFSIPNHLMRYNYRYEPLRVHGVPAVVHLAGTNTLRLTMQGLPTKHNQQIYLNYLLFIPTSQGLTASDNFNDGNDTTPPPAWTRYNPIGTGSWSFPGGNTYRIQSAASPNPATLGQGRAGSIHPGTYGDFYVAADIVAWDDTIHQVFGVLARVGTPGPGTTTGYMFTHDRGNPASSTSGDMDIVRLDNEAATSLPTTGSDSIHLEPGKQYRFAFTGIGDTLIGQVYLLPDTSVPVVTITATDTAYGSGASGLVVANNASPTYDGPADATFDNFLATTGEPRLSVSVSAGAVTLTWPMIPFALQSTSTIDPAVWTPVNSGITQAGSLNVYTVPAGTGPLFFRLAYP